MTDRRCSPAGTGHKPLDLNWLVRYARHCRFPLPERQLPDQVLRAAFGAPAWRIVCRSPKERFLPILRNQELSIHSLITYCQRLAKRSFAQAPQAVLLAYFVAQRRRFHDTPCRVPEAEDFDLIRVADREAHLSMSDIALVANWALQANFCVQTRHRWPAMVARARQYRQAERVRLAASNQSAWHFYCRALPWRGYWIEPLTNSAQLWAEGMALGHCVYRLRSLCACERPSRFFSIQAGIRRLATLELAWRPPERGDRGMDRQWGQWQLQDLRLAYNRPPDLQLLEAMRAFAWMFNVWAKRPARVLSSFHAVNAPPSRALSDFGQDTPRIPAEYR